MEHIYIQKASTEEVCPVLAVTQYLALRSGANGPLFIHLNGALLTALQVSVVLKKAVSSIALNQSNFNTHSFRIGAATSAAAGIPIEEIMTMGRWKTKCVMSYIRPHML